MSDDEQAEGQHRAPVSSAPNLMLFGLAILFIAAMGFNLLSHGSERLTIFFGTAALVLSGVDIGKMIGRK